uniref:UBA domain-containing protein n=1 Tax=Steinernema glaseri TaxID=37863 RepID=A0A1I7Y3X2_9BILA
MEAGWTLDELCRFRLFTPEQYDKLKLDSILDSKKSGFNIAVRKRAAPSDEASSSAPPPANDTADASSKLPVKETPWSLNEVTFIHEEKSNDSAIVKLIDGAYCAVVYKKNDGTEKEGDEDLKNLRLMRMDDLVVVSPNKTPRSPECFQKSFVKIPTHEALGGTRIISTVVDDTGVRILCEKRNRLHLLRISILGKLFSDHTLPWYGPAFEGCGKQPEVANFGDEFFLMIRDGNGCLVPMLRNAVGGYREPAYLASSNITHFSIGLRHLEITPPLSSNTILSSSPFVPGSAFKNSSMTERKHLFLFGHALPGNGQSLIDRIQGCFKHHNNYGSESLSALDKIPAETIKQMIVGPTHVCFLFENGQIARLKFDVVEARNGSAEKPSSGNPSSGSGSSAPGPGSSSSAAPGTGPSSSSGAASTGSVYASAASRTAKFRRVMMAARRPNFGERTGVIVDRARSMVPASSIPEELIAQAQVVLQGKSREVIVRELQRTNLNVNEAVNNLLSRDDDEGDDAADAYLPEELLSLLDAGLRTDPGGALIDADAFYSGSDFDYLVARDLAARRRGDKDKKEKSKDGSSDAVQQQFCFDERLQFWMGHDRHLPHTITKFVSIAATYTQLFALADNGHLYAWRWDHNRGQTEAHPRSTQLLPFPAKDEKIESFATCAWRVVVRTNKNRIGTFMDCYMGKKMQPTMNLPLQSLPDPDTKILSLHSCSSLAVVRTTDGFYWCGMYPFNERRKNWEKVKSRTKKHVTFDVNEITIGSEVRTKAHPIYLAGSVAVNFSGGTPMVGVLMEAGWTLDELCRFRLFTPEQYDKLKLDSILDSKKSGF